MEYKVAELEGELLDAAVSLAEGVRADLAFWGDSEPSRRWDHGGPIIEREQICLITAEGETTAYIGNIYALGNEICGCDFDACGPTPLIAAMRAYVASKFGETVQLP